MKLTKREEVLKKSPKGKDRKTIADEMGVSVNTIAAHIRNLHKKSKTHSYAELVLLLKKHPKKNNKINLKN